MVFSLPDTELLQARKGKQCSPETSFPFLTQKRCIEPDGLLGTELLLSQRSPIECSATGIMGCMWCRALRNVERGLPCFPILGQLRERAKQLLQPLS